MTEAARFFALAVDVFSVIGLDGVVRGINDSVQRLLGYSPAEVVGRPVFDFVTPEDQHAVRQQLRRAAEGHETVNFECRCLHRDGSLRWVACSCPPPAENEDALLVVARDVTLQKRLQLELRQWKHRYDAAARATGNVVYERDLRTGRLVWGRNLEELAGYSRSELGSWDLWLGLIHPDDHPQVVQGLAEAEADSNSAHLEYRVRRKDDTYMSVQDDLHFFREPGRSGRRVVGCVRDISARKRAEEQFRQLVEAVPSGILLLDDHARITFASSRMEKLFGYAPAELIGQDIDLLLPDRSAPGRAHVKDSAVIRRMRGMTHGVLLWGRHQEGRRLPLDVTFSPIAVHGQPLVVCTITELSERIGAQKALWDSEHRLRDILDNATAVVYVKDCQGRYLLVNRRFEQLFGVDRKSLQGKSDEDLFPAETADQFRANDLRVLETEGVIEAEELVPQADGPHTYITVKFPLRDADAQIYAVAGISTDITDRLRAAREIQQVHRRMELIVNSIAEGIFGVDPAGRMTFVNPAAEAMLGCDAKAVIGRPYQEILREAYADESVVADEDDLIRQALDRGQPVRGEDRMFCRSGGSLFPVEYRGTPLEEEGRPVGLVVTFHDTTERKRRQQVEHELGAARRVQERLYPQSPPEVPGFDLAGHAFPASQACGDYFDFIPLPDGSCALAVADVAGHGLGPALQMVQARAYLRAMLTGGTSPGDALRMLNRRMVEDTPQEAFVTLFLAVLDSQSRSLVYAGAGHDARLLRSDDRVEPLPSTGLVLGVLPDAPLEIQRSGQLEPGDVLLMLTDGVLEACSADRELFGWERTLAVVRAHRQRPAAEIIQQIYQAARDFAGGQPQADDLTIVIAKAL